MSSRLETQISEDGLEARVCVVAGPASNREEVDAALCDAGVCQGFLEDALDGLAEELADPSFCVQDLLVAKGEPPRDGTDGELEFSLSSDIPASHLESPAKKGKAGPERHFTVVIPRKELAVYQPPGKGQTGCSVTGEPLPFAEGRDPLDDIGEGLECTAGGKLCATAVGVVIRSPGERLEVRPLPAEKRLWVDVRDDSMRATVRVFPGEPGDASEVQIALERAGVTAGVVQELSERIAAKLSDPLFVLEEQVVAMGLDPIPGVDGIFSPAFAEEAPAGLVGPGMIDEVDRIDFWDRSLLVPVEPNEIIGMYTRATKGEPGRTVRGEEVPSVPGVERMPNYGEGIDKKSRTDTIRAGRSGVLMYQEAKQLDVVDVSEHRGDVDLTSGSLRVSGSIAISGSVTNNARVEATGDVVIGGLVDGGGVASDGQVTVAGGVIGQGTAWVRSRGDMACNHTLGARIESRETLVIQKTAINSSLSARVVSGPFKVLGGEIHAVERIAIQEAGSPAGSGTILEVGRALPVCEDAACENVSLAFQSDSKVRAPRRVVVTDERAPDPEGVPADDAADAGGLFEAARIEVEGVVHPGVLVRIGPHSTLVDQALRNIRFRFDKDSTPPIVAEPLEP